MSVVTGGLDLLVRLRVRDHAHLRDLLLTKIFQIPGVQRTETFLSLADVEPDNFTAALLDQMSQREARPRDEGPGLAQRESGVVPRPTRPAANLMACPPAMPIGGRPDGKPQPDRPAHRRRPARVRGQARPVHAGAGRRGAERWPARSASLTCAPSGSSWSTSTACRAASRCRRRRRSPLCQRAGLLRGDLQPGHRQPGVRAGVRRRAAGSASRSSPASPTSSWCPTRPPSSCCRGPTGTGWMLCDVYFGNGQPMPLDGRGLMRRMLADLAEAGYDYLAGHRDRVLHRQARRRAAHAGERRVHAAAAAGERVRARLPVPVRGAAGQRGRHARGDPRRPVRGRAAAALDGGRVGPRPDGVQLQPDGRAGRRRRGRAVPLGGQADVPAPRAARHLHVPPGAAELLLLRLAPARVAAVPRRRAERVRQRRPTPCPRRAGSSSPGCSTTRCR